MGMAVICCKEIAYGVRFGARVILWSRPKESPKFMVECKEHTLEYDYNLLNKVIQVLMNLSEHVEF